MKMNDEEDGLNDDCDAWNPKNKETSKPPTTVSLGADHFEDIQHPSTRARRPKPNANRDSQPETFHPGPNPKDLDSVLAATLDTKQKRPQTVDPPLCARSIMNKTERFIQHLACDRIYTSMNILRALFAQRWEAGRFQFDHFTQVSAATIAIHIMVLSMAARWAPGHPRA